MRHLIVLLCCLMLAAPVGRADVAPEPLMTGGNNPSPRAKTEVAMVWEEVDLRVSAEKNETTAVFGLKNLGGSATEFEVGFPSYFEMPLQDFSVTIDGEKHLAAVKKEGVKDFRGRERFTYWMCWTMKFEPGQERKVEVKYWVKPEVRHELYTRELSEAMQGKLCEMNSGYVLRTGRDWAGSIGKAVIRVHYNESVTKQNLTFGGAKRNWVYDPKTNTDTLTLKDLEPDDSSDISYSFYAASPKERAETLTGLLKEKKLQPWSMQCLLDLLEKKNALGLAKEDLAKKTGEILDLMTEQAYDQAKLSPGAEDVVLKVYRRALAGHQAAQDAGGARKIAQPYEKFMAFMLERDKAYKGKGGYKGREYAQLEVEYAKVVKLLEPAAPAKE
ncbi:MAG: hypothetical protein KIS92_17050 [Planctomycetota bacterium]|nr:hypothetical protein [Planctomycetota bacterium]